MSIFVEPKKFLRWLKRAMFANISKNKVRKETWQELSSFVEFKDPGNWFEIPSADFLSLQTFCLIDGKGENLSSDSLLNFASTLNDLLTRLLEHNSDLATALRPPQVHPDVKDNL